jgi:hypothetical protein
LPTCTGSEWTACTKSGGAVGPENVEPLDRTRAIGIRNGGPMRWRVRSLLLAQRSLSCWMFGW